MGDGNQVIDCEIYNWYYYGVRHGGGPSTNGLISGCDIYQTSPGTTSPYGIYVLGAEGLIVEKCNIREIMGTSLPRGMYVMVIHLMDHLYSEITSFHFLVLQI